MAQTDYLHESQESILWNSTELVTPENLNDMQQMAERRMLDYAIRGVLLEAGDFDSSGPFATWLRPVGRALSLTGFSESTPFTVTVRAGTILWRGGVDPGQPDPRWQMHYLPSDVVVGVDNPDPTNPRIDILSAKIEYDALDTSHSTDAQVTIAKTVGGNLIEQVFDKRRRTLLTIRYTPGTPAGSPTPPATPAGYVKFAEIEVAAAATTFSSISSTLDHRTPAGMRRISVAGTQAFFTDFATKGTTTIPRRLVATAANQVAYWLLDPGGCGMEIPTSLSATGQHARHVRLRSLTAFFTLGSSPGAFELVSPYAGGSLGVIQSFSTATSAVWHHFVPTDPVWLDHRSSASLVGHRNTLTFMGNATEGMPGIHVRATAAASGNFVEGIFADFWGF